MKKVIFVGLFLSICISVLAQPPEVFRVIVVSGSVQNAKTKLAVQKGDQISANESLAFGTKDSYVIVISPKTGRKTIRGVPDAAPRELTNLLQSFLKPDEKSTASRGLETEYWASLNASLMDTVLILGDGIIALDKDYVKLSPPSVVIAYFKGKNGEHISRVISVGQSICLGRKCLLEDGAQVNSSKIMVEYYQDEKLSRDLPGSGDFIGYFWPRYGNDKKIEEEVKIIIETLEKSPRDQILSEIRKFLSAEYGHIQEQNLNTWLQNKKILTP